MRVGRAVAGAWIFGGALVGLALGAGLEDGPTGTVEGLLEPTELISPVEVRFIPEQQMEPFLEASLGRMNEELERAEAVRNELEARMEQAKAAHLHAEAALEKTRSEILQRRLVALRESATVGQLASQRRALTARSGAARQQVLALKQEAEAARQAWLRAEQEVARIADGTALYSALPPPVEVASAGPDGRFEAKLAPGRYTVAASTRAPDGSSRVWLFWTRVEAGGVRELQLTSGNLAPSECDTCVISPRGPVVHAW